MLNKTYGRSLSDSDSSFAVAQFKPLGHSTLFSIISFCSKLPIYPVDVKDLVYLQFSHSISFDKNLKKEQLYFTY